MRRKTNVAALCALVAPAALAVEPPEDEPPEDEPTTAEHYQQEEQAAQQTGAQGFFQRTADNITTQLTGQWDRFAGFLGADPISGLGDEWAKFNERLRFATRLDIGLAYTALYQRATDGFPGLPRSASAGDFDFYGSWHLVGEEGLDAGTLGFKTELRHTYGSIPPRDLNKTFGGILKTVNGYNEHDFSLKELWWQQYMADGMLLLRFGKIDMSNFFSTGRFQSDAYYFLNQAFSSNLAVPFPDTGPGAVLFVFPEDWVYVAGGLGQSNPDDASFGFDDLLDGDGEFFTAVEVGFISELEGLGPGTWRFTFSHTDGDSKAGRPAGGSFAISFDQQMGNFVPFLRYAYANQSGLATISQIFTIGFGVFDPLGNEGDVMGFGYAIASPDNTALPNETVLEAFYRLQITPTLQITPDVQVYLNPSLNPTLGAVAVFGVRVRIQY